LQALADSIRAGDRETSLPALTQWVRDHLSGTGRPLAEHLNRRAR